jgi:hypothetical protein
MMRVVRATVYVTPDNGKTLILRADALKVSVEKYVEEMQYGEGAGGALVICDVFDHPTEDPLPYEITKASWDRYLDQRERERNQAILYFWDAAQLPRIRAGGFLSGTTPAPLTVEEIHTVLRQLAKHPDYNAQTIQVISEDAKLVRMKNGDVTVEELTVYGEAKL